MFLKRLKRFFKLIKKDVSQNERIWVILLKIVGGVIVMLAVALAVILVLTGIGYIITFLWRLPYIQSRTSGPEQSVYNSYTNIGLAFVVLTEIAGFLVYDLFKFFGWLLRKWKEAEKEE